MDGQTRRTFAAIVAVILATLASGLLFVDWSADISVADWVASCTTAIALVITLLLLRNELDDRRRRKRDEDRESARRVSAWVAHPDPENPVAEITVRNLGDEPVFDVRAYVWPEPEEAEHRVGFMAEVLPPNDDGVATVDLWWEGDRRVQLDITDSAGLHWRRRSNGVVESLPDRDLSPCWNHDNHENPEVWA